MDQLLKMVEISTLADRRNLCAITKISFLINDLLT
tara:strand:- start:356 stop:460 length:105 start_codon:yes stop_codon:yes gene_type:complete